jgi:hypothetical protein
MCVRLLMVIALKGYHDIISNKLRMIRTEEKKIMIITNKPGIFRLADISAAPTLING